jgi:ATP synthase protein I
MNDTAVPKGTVPRGAVVVSGPTPSLWLRILLAATTAAAALLLVLVGISFFASGAGAALSAVFGGGLVVVFFGVSLLAGHLVGRKNPSGAIGVFVVTYFFKVVGFAVALFAIGAPPWLDRTWFLASAVAVVVVWQGAEIMAFSRSRLQIFNDAPKAQAASDG